MWRYILRRTLQMIPTVFGVIVITFILFNVVGGSPASMVLGKHVSPKALEEFDEARGFNKPLLLGNWATTRAYSETPFDQNAGPWTSINGVEYRMERGGEPGRIALTPDRVYALPLNFSLQPETTYRWKLDARSPEGGTAILEVVTPAAESEEEPRVLESFVVAAGDDWDRDVITWETGADPENEALRLRVLDAAVEIKSLELHRRVDNLFDSQFIFYLKQLARLDFGVSHSTNQRVTKLLADGVLPSLTLTVPIFLVGMVVAISLSLLCAFFRDTWLDRGFVVLSVALMSINYLVWIVVGQYYLGYKKGLFPVWGYESAAFLALPVLIGVVSGLGVDLRFYRTIMLDEMYKEYIRTAFAKGLSKPAVLFKHVLKNAMIPVVTNTVIAIPFLYTGSLLLESFFGIPGLGYLGINAINSSDVDVIRGVVLLGSVIFVIANLLTDIVYAWVDPRVKLQ